MNFYLSFESVTDKAKINKNIKPNISLNKINCRIENAQNNTIKIVFIFFCFSILFLIFSIILFFFNAYINHYINIAVLIY